MKATSLRINVSNVAICFLPLQVKRANITAASVCWNARAVTAFAGLITAAAAPVVDMSRMRTWLLLGRGSKVAIRFR